MSEVGDRRVASDEVSRGHRIVTHAADEADGARGAPLADVSLRRAILAAALVSLVVALLRPEAASAAILGLGIAAAGLLLVSRGTAARRSQAAENAGDAAGVPDRRLRAVVDALREPALLVDREMLLRHGNPATADAFGAMTLGDALSMRFRAPDFLAAVEGAIASGAPAESLVEDRRPADRLWLVEIAPLDMGPPVSAAAPAGGLVLLLFHDRTAERRLERMRTDFVANASHELRTPLSSLIGFIETLQGPARRDEAARERFLSIMRDQANRMARLIDDLLSLSRVEMKRHLALSTEIDLRDVLESVLVEATLLAEENGLEIRFERPDEAFMVLGDEDELIQVFTNLVENACKYAASGGRIDLDLARASDGGRSCFDAGVRDFGPGIPPEHVPRLTERFYRVDVASSRSKQGTGLGLSIVRNILLRHRAQLIITSKLGEGSLFRARFPAAIKSPSRK